MAKKQRRQVSQSVVIASSEKGNPALARTGVAVGEFKPDYSATTHDLKRIGIIAGAFVVILIALSFFLK